jgi:hypothetical protein
LPERLARGREERSARPEERRRRRRARRHAEIEQPPTVDEKADRKEGERGCRFLYRGQTHVASETKRGVNVYFVLFSCREEKIEIINIGTPKTKGHWKLAKQMHYFVHS